MTITERLRPLLLAAALAACALPACAKDVVAGPLKLTHPWSRPTPPGAPTGVGYLVIANAAATGDRLVSAASPAASRTEVHEMSMDGGVMRMRPVTGGLAVPAGGRVELKPGGYHLMLIGLKAALIEGAEVPVTLTFEKAGPVRIALKVETGQ